MATRSSHNNTQPYQETSRLCRLLCVNPIDRIPLLELKRVIHAFKQPLSSSDINLQPCSALLVMIVRAEIKRRLSDLEGHEPLRLANERGELILCDLLMWERDDGCQLLLLGAGMHHTNGLGHL